MPVRYLSFALLAVTIWAGNTIVNKLAAGALPPGSIAFLRWLLAFAALTPFVARDAWRRRAAIRADLLKLALLGLLGMALCQGVGYYAASYTSATNMALLLSLAPLLTLLLAALFHKEVPSAIAIAGGLLSLLGIFVVLGHGDPLVLLAQGVGRGDAMMFVVVLAYAAYSVLLRNAPPSLPVFTSLYAQMACALVFLLPVYLWSATPHLTWATVSMIGYAGIPASIVAPAVWMMAIKHLGSGRTTMFMNLIPIITAVAAAVFLDEALHAYHLIGGGLTIGGVLLGQSSLKARRTAPAS